MCMWCVFCVGVGVDVGVCIGGCVHDIPAFTEKPKLPTLSSFPGSQRINFQRLQLNERVTPHTPAAAVP